LAKADAEEDEARGGVEESRLHRCHACRVTCLGPYIVQDTDLHRYAALDWTLRKEW